MNMCVKVKLSRETRKRTFVDRKNVTSYSKEGPLSLFLQIKQNTLSLDDVSQCATTFHSRMTIFGPSSFVFDVISSESSNLQVFLVRVETWKLGN